MAKEHRVDFETIKASADFRAVLAHYELEASGQGRQTKIRCPFHDDRRPSCSVNLEKRLFRYHDGGRGVSGNVLDFVHRMETRDGVTTSLRQAAIRLTEMCGLPHGGGNGAPRRQEGRREGMAKVKASNTAGSDLGAPGAPTALGEASGPGHETRLNQVERFFAVLTERQLRRGIHRSSPGCMMRSPRSSTSTTPTPSPCAGPNPPTTSWPASSASVTASHHPILTSELLSQNTRLNRS
jgi:hypothetical protein